MDCYTNSYGTHTHTDIAKGCDRTKTRFYLNFNDVYFWIECTNRFRSKFNTIHFAYVKYRRAMRFFFPQTPCFIFFLYRMKCVCLSTVSGRFNSHSIWRKEMRSSSCLFWNKPHWTVTCVHTHSRGSSSHTRNEMKKVNFLNCVLLVPG